ncbi:hypothetical protein J2X68_001086 [Streptomyces sp. 3330]|uniref:hypothetical protein n=1 Tax=Streptomyces sp. 3330 TaxID=2817755 RepID=UPI00285BC404|nr:hypothetical protein [Streptomyces sp. 3330]MDR6974408.1 hypothetical protein [Streptomyces sp. 3330]
MRNRHITVAVGITALALTGCNADTSDGSSKSGSSADKTPVAAASATPDTSDVLADSGIPSKPTGARRQALLDLLAAAAPQVVKYEDKAIDAARNQCSAINDEGVQRIDWLASQRFTYKDVVTTEEQGKKINQALKDDGFCTS